MRYLDVPLITERPRVVSLDALRGFNFFWILGGDGAILALAVMLNNKGPASSAVANFLRTQMTHSAWEGFTFYDFIFPLFIFITGVAIVLSLPQLAARAGMARAHLRVLRRALLLYGLGIIYYGGVGGAFGDLRYVGVLQRIAICYLFASLLVLHFGWRGIAGSLVALLAGYWALMTFVPVPGIGAGSFTQDANLAYWVDAHYLPGRMWDKTSDPEGILSTLPAIATCLMGVLAGLLLQDERFTPQRKSLYLIGGGMLMVAGGYLWALQFPIVKAIWTSSFALVAGGCSAILLGAIHQLVDVWGYKRWATALVWIGGNAILLYFINGITGFVPFARRFVGGDVALYISSVTTPGTGNFVAHLVALGFVIALAGFLYCRKIFLRV